MHEVELNKTMWEWLRATGLAHAVNENTGEMLHELACQEFVKRVVEATGMKFTAAGELAFKWESEQELKKTLARAVEQTARRDAVIDEVMRLYESGYDGPFMGEPIKPLFKAIIAMTGRDDAPRRQAPDEWEPPGRLKRTPRPTDKPATGKRRRGRR